MLAICVLKQIWKAMAIKPARVSHYFEQEIYWTDVRVRTVLDVAVTTLKFKLNCWYKRRKAVINHQCRTRAALLVIAKFVDHDPVV